MESKPMIQRLKDYLREHPFATDQEIEEGIGIDPDIRRVYMSRLNRQQKIYVDDTEDGKRRILVLEAPEGDNFKREALQMMVDRYLEDFEAAQLYTERVEIGKMILRILEKL